jgi:hypothetical protein
MFCAMNKNLTSCLNGHKQLAVLVPRYYSQPFLAA